MHNDSIYWSYIIIILIMNVKFLKLTFFLSAKNCSFYYFEF